MRQYLGELVMASRWNWHLKMSPCFSPSCTRRVTRFSFCCVLEAVSLSFGLKGPCLPTNLDSLTGSWTRPSRLSTKCPQPGSLRRIRGPCLLLTPVIPFLTDSSLVGQCSLALLNGLRRPKWNHRPNSSSLYQPPLLIPTCSLSCLLCNRQIPFPQSAFTDDSYVCRKQRLR